MKKTPTSPEPPTPTPTPPEYLGPEGRKLWEKHVENTSDLETLELYCASYQRWITAGADVQENGMTLILTNERGQQTAKANPACAVEAAQARIMMSCQRKLGSVLHPKLLDAFSEFD
ncbi:MAG: P27 family phage terminase small subunit [Verrucomicrobia bacterium]|nr:P27 family phage terminase small subunit [Verrucomicrobiota bacterium]